MNAISLNAAAMNLLRLLAPALAGFFIALWSIEGVYYMMCGLYLMGFFFASRLPATEKVKPIEKTGPLTELRDGLSYIRHNKIIFNLLILTLFSTILSMPYFFLLPIFAKDIFIVTVEDLGWFASLPLIGGLIATLAESSARQGLLISTSGIGALVGSLILASMSNRGRGLILLLSLTLTGASLVIFSLTGSFLIALLIFLPLGLGQAGRMALSNTLLQAYTDDAYRGRVMSVYMMEWGITFIGVFFVGLLADFTGVRWAVGGSAGLLILASLYFLINKTEVRRMD
jgi:MFS family permease